jgi:5'-3' exonuclease
LSSRKRVVIIDQLNLFFRSYIVNPSLSTNGFPIGGLKGTIASLQKICREIKPDEIIFCWDGPGGSVKRKKILKDYKAGRAPIRLNREVRNLSPEEEQENKIWQQTRLVEYFNSMPVVQLMYAGTEADDVISYVKNSPH